MIDSPFAATLAALTERMGVPHTTETGVTQRSRVEWRRSGAIKPGPCPFHVSRKTVAGRLAHPHLVTFYADSDTEVCSLLAQFWGHLDLLCGPAQGADEDRLGYALEPGEIRGIVGGDGTGAGYACDVAVTLYTLAYSEIHGTATAHRPTLAITPQTPAALTGTPLTALG